MSIWWALFDGLVVCADLMVQAIFVLVKIIAATGGQCRSLMYSSAASCPPDCRFEYTRWVRSFGSYFRLPANPPAFVTTDIESGEQQRSYQWSSHDSRSDHSRNGGADHIRKVAAVFAAFLFFVLLLNLFVLMVG